MLRKGTIKTTPATKRNRKEAQTSGSGGKQRKEKKEKILDMEEIISISDDEESGNLNKAKRLLYHSDISGSENKITFLERELSLENVASPDLLTSALGTVAELNRLQVSSKNLSGKVSGNMKKGFQKIKSIVTALT